MRIGRAHLHFVDWANGKADRLFPIQLPAVDRARTARNPGGLCWQSGNTDARRGYWYFQFDSGKYDDKPGSPLADAAAGALLHTSTVRRYLGIFRKASTNPTTDEASSATNVIDRTRIVKRAGKRRRFGVLASGTVLFAVVVLNSQVARSQPQYVGPSILPPAPDAIFGGNPFQGLGRSDDPGPSREKQFGYPTYNDSAFNANHMQDQPAPTFYSNSYAMYPHPEEATTGIGTGAGIAPFPVSGPGGGTFANEQGTTTGSGSPSGSGITASDRLSQGYGGGIAPGTSAQQGGGGGGAAGIGGSSGAAGPGGPGGSGGPSGIGGTGVGGFGSGNGGASPNGLPEGYLPTSSLDTPTRQTSTPLENGWPSGNPAGTSAFSNNSTFAPGFGGQAGYGTPLTPDEITQKQAGNPNTAARQAFIEANTPPTRSAETKGNRLLTDFVARRGQHNSVGANDDQKSPYAVPPQPETPLSDSGISGKSDMPGKHPLGEAINDIKGGRLQDAMNHLNEILQNDQDNANAHYLKAVVSVLTRNFDQAKEEYQETLRLSQNGELTRRAQLGLSKLTH